MGCCHGGTQAARRVERAAGSWSCNQRSAEDDGSYGKWCYSSRGAFIGGHGNDHESKESGKASLYCEGAFNWYGRQCDPVCQRAIKHPTNGQRCCNGTTALKSDVRDYVPGRESPRRPQRDGHCGIDMCATQMACSSHNDCDDEAECQCDSSGPERASRCRNRLSSCANRHKCKCSQTLSSIPSPCLHCSFHFYEFPPVARKVAKSWGSPAFITPCIAFSTS